RGLPGGRGARRVVRRRDLDLADRLDGMRPRRDPPAREEPQEERSASRAMRPFAPARPQAGGNLPFKGEAELAPARIVAGIDEAGLGPLLGPLAIGFSAFRVPDPR